MQDLNTKTPGHKENLTSSLLIFFLFGLLVLGSHSYANTETAISADDLNHFADDVIPHLMEKEHIPGAAFVFVQNGKVLLQKEFGYANVEKKELVRPTTIFPIGSVSKVFTATALAQLADRKKINLNSDVNQYLTRLKVPATYPQPIAGKHLLNHTSGLDEIRPGTQAPSPKEILPLHEFLKDRLVRVHPPGLITSYSTYGITLAGLLVEEISGVPFETYLEKNIWKPLNMSHSHISTPSGLTGDVATAYAWEDDALRKISYEWYHTLPASSIRSTAADMANFLIAHLQRGRFGDQQILTQRAADEMHQTQSTTHPQMPGWTYGFQEDNANGLRIIEHGGDIAGFSSLLTLIPEKNAGFFIVHHLEGSNLRFELKQKLLDRYFPDRRPVVAPVPRPDPGGKLKRFGGVYRANLFCHTCKAPMPVPEVQVTANGDGTITIWENQWVETSPLLFTRIDGKRKIGFQQDNEGHILQLSAGSWKVLEKIK